jgi:hypothetical protein
MSELLSSTVKPPTSINIQTCEAAMSEVKEEKEEGYTQREWDRVVGYGAVPPEYQRKARHNEYLEKQRRYDKG